MHNSRGSPPWSKDEGRINSPAKGPLRHHAFICTCSVYRRVSQYLIAKLVMNEERLRQPESATDALRRAPVGQLPRHDPGSDMTAVVLTGGMSLPPDVPCGVVGVETADGKSGA